MTIFPRQTIKYLRLAYYKLNQLLYQFSPFPDAAGSFRQTNNVVLRSNFETSDYHDIISQIMEVDTTVKSLVTDINNISLTEFIDSVVQIHHRMTVIHPFPDGNGRVSRAFLNWMFRLKGLPPFSLKHENKQRYLDALSKADGLGDYDPLIEIFYREILRSMYELNQNLHNFLPTELER